jgi:hypothetical protein
LRAHPNEKSYTVLTRWKRIVKSACWGAIVYSFILTAVFALTIGALNSVLFRTNWSVESLLVPPLVIGSLVGFFLRGTTALVKEWARHGRALSDSKAEE